MQWIDEMAGIVSMRHAGGRITTACIDNLNFKAGAYLNDTIVLIGRITYVGRTSMEVRVDTYVEDLDGMRRVINRAYVVMVAIDEEGHAAEVPGLIVKTESEKAEWAAGEPLCPAQTKTQRRFLEKGRKQDYENSHSDYERRY